MINQIKTQPPVNRNGLFTKDRFTIDWDDDQVWCPSGDCAPIRWHGDGSGTVNFGGNCARCPLREKCTTAQGGRTITINANERALQRARARRNDPARVEDYRATRPKVERKLGHLMARRHGGRRARVRGLTKVDADFRLRAAAINIARIAASFVRSPTNRTSAAAT